MMKNKSEKISFTFKKNKDTILSPLLELYRGKVYIKILQSFIKNSIKCFGKEIFSVKKSCVRNLTNILSGWMFSLYSDYDFNGDPFLPNNYNNVNFLKIIFNDLIKFDKNIVNSDEKINFILDNLVNTYGYNLDLLNNYKKSNYFNKNKRNFILKLNLKNKDYKGDFYKFNIKFIFSINNTKLSNILDNLYIPVSVYERIKKRYTGEKNNMDEYIWIILFRYCLLGSNNHQLGILPDVLDKMKNDLNLNFECFASSLNSYLPNYCSIYYDVEKYFGSKGSFFNLKPHYGTYSFNPPYQIDIINRGINILFNHLEEAFKNGKELNFIITIPIWDKIGKDFIKNNYNFDLKKEIDYGNFKIIDQVKQSKFFLGLRMIYKDNFTYLDHGYNVYKDVTIQNTYVIVLSSKTGSKYIDIINQYSFKKTKSSLSSISDI
jgi:hypothetical protein